MTGWQVVLVLSMGGFWLGGFLTGRGTAPRPYPRDTGVTFDPGTKTWEPGWPTATRPDPVRYEKW